MMCAKSLCYIDVLMKKIYLPNSTSGTLYRYRYFCPRHGEAIGGDMEMLGVCPCVRPSVRPSVRQKAC